MSNDEKKPGFTINFDNQGNEGNQQINMGEQVDATQVNQASAEQITIEQFFESVETEVLKGLPKEEAKQVQETVIQPLMAKAAEVDKGEDSDGLDTEEKQKSWLRGYVDKLLPFAPKVGKCIAAFTEAALNTLKEKNWVIAGVAAVAGELKKL